MIIGIKPTAIPEEPFLKTPDGTGLVGVSRDLRPLYLSIKRGNSVILLAENKPLPGNTVNGVSFSDSFLWIRLNPSTINIYPVSRGFGVRLDRGNDLILPEEAHLGIQSSKELTSASFSSSPD